MYSRRNQVFSLLAVAGLLMFASPTALAQSFQGSYSIGLSCSTNSLNTNGSFPDQCGTDHQEYGPTGCSSSCASAPEPHPSATVSGLWDRGVGRGVVTGTARVDASLLGAPCGGASDGGITLQQIVTASDLVFYVRDNPGQSGSVLPVMHVEFRGRVDATFAGCPGNSAAEMTIIAGMHPNNPIADYVNTRLSPFSSANPSYGPLAAYGNDDSVMNISFSTDNVPFGSPTFVHLRMITRAHSGLCGTVGGTFSEAHGTLSFPATGVVFDLPPGITCRSEQMNIVDNHWAGAVALTQQPAAQSTCPSGAASFAVTTAGAGPFTYRWRKDAVPIDTIANPSAATATLSFTNVSATDAGSYDCMITSACGSLTSNTATLTVLTVGSGDGNVNGATDGADIQGFVNLLLLGGSPSATNCSYDMNADGGVTIADVSQFVAALLG